MSYSKVDEEVLIKEGTFKGVKGFILDYEMSVNAQVLVRVQVDDLNIITVPHTYIETQYEDYLICVKDIETRDIIEILDKKRLKKDEVKNYISKIYNDMCKKFEKDNYGIYVKWCSPYNRYSVFAQPISELELKLDNYIIKPDMIKKIWDIKL